MPAQPPQDPNHPLNAQRQPFYRPGMAYGASPTYSGYGASPDAAPARMSLADFARAPSTYGVDPTGETGRGIGAFRQQAMNDNMAMIQSGDRQASRLAQVRAPMTADESRHIAANYGSRAYMKGGLLAQGQAPAAPQGIAGIGAGPQQPMAAVQQTQAQPMASIGAAQPPPAPTPYQPKPITINHPAKDPSVYSHALALRQAQRQGVRPMSAPGVAAQPQVSPMSLPGGRQLIDSDLMQKWFPTIQQEDALHNRMLSAQASAMEQKAAEHPLASAVREGVAAGTLPFDQGLKNWSLLHPGVGSQPADPARPPAQSGPKSVPPQASAPQAAAGNMAEHYFKVLHPELADAFYGQAAPGGTQVPNNLEQIYGALESRNPEGFQDPNSQLWANARQYAQQTLGSDQFKAGIGNVPDHPGNLNAYGRLTHGYSPFGGQEQVESYIQKKMAPLRMFSGNQQLQPRPYKPPDSPWWAGGPALESYLSHNR